MRFIEVHGVPVLCNDWRAWDAARDSDDRVIARTLVNGAEVSTVFLGISAEHPPTPYETMVFGAAALPHGCGYSECVEQYRTRAEAVAGHARIVAAAERGECPCRAEEN